jgi:hypothetical protein
MREDDEHMTVDPLMLHLRLPATWYEKALTPESTLELEKILFLILAMLDCGVSLYEIQLRITKGDE